MLTHVPKPYSAVLVQYACLELILWRLNFGSHAFYTLYLRMSLIAQRRGTAVYINIASLYHYPPSSARRSLWRPSALSLFPLRQFHPRSPHSRVPTHPWPPVVSISLVLISDLTYSISRPFPRLSNSRRTIACIIFSPLQMTPSLSTPSLYSLSSPLFWGVVAILPSM